MDPTPSPWRALARRTHDVQVAAATAAFPLAVLFSDALVLDSGGREPLWAVLVVATCAPLVLRRRFPLLVAAACVTIAVATAAYANHEIAVVPAIVAIGSAGYHLPDGRGSRTARRCTLVVIALACAAAYAYLTGAGLYPTVVLFTAGLGLAPVAIGVAMRSVADRSAELERARSELARADERARLASDVHDAVGHHLSAIRMQAVGGRRRLHGAHPEADRVLGTVADLAHLALDDIRQMLDRLRSEADDPVPGLADLPPLAERLGGDGLRIDLSVGSGLVETLPAPLQTCSYRVVQESLTNVVRHSRAGRAIVRLDREEGGLAVVVDDPGPPRRGGAPDRPGGVASMRERVRSLGGELDAAPHGRRGWRVRATLPWAP